MKTCSLCGKEKQDALFLQNLSSDGLHHCRHCYGLSRHPVERVIVDRDGDKVINEIKSEVLVKCSGEEYAEPIMPKIRRCPTCKIVFLSREDLRYCSRCRDRWAYYS